MPIAYACICPTTPPQSETITSDALRRVADELSGYEPELVLVIAPAASGASKIGVFASDSTLLDRIVVEAKKNAVPVERLLRWTIGEPALAVDAPERAYIATCGLDPRLHFEFGRAAARAIESLEQRIAVVCAVQLSKGNQRFDAQYRRALASWDVKSMVNTDVPSRRSARERAVPQTALLMGVLGGYRVQPRELSHESSPTGGYFVAAIDVLGPRRA